MRLFKNLVKKCVGVEAESAEKKDDDMKFSLFCSVWWWADQFEKYVGQEEMGSLTFTTSRVRASAVQGAPVHSIVTAVDVSVMMQLQVEVPRCSSSSLWLTFL